MGHTHLVGGYVEPGEDPLTAAHRELREETGYNAGHLELISGILADSGGSERVIWVYLATRCIKGEKGEDGIAVVLMSPAEFWRLITTYCATPGEPRKGLMSLTVATLAFNRLGLLKLESIGR